MATDDSMSDDVFEDDTTDIKSRLDYNHDDGLHIGPNDLEFRTPSPTGYPGFKPPREALRLYALQSEYFNEQVNFVVIFFMFFHIFFQIFFAERWRR